MQLEFRAPGVALALERLLRRALPELAADAAERLISDGAVEVGARRRPGSETRVRPGSRVRVAWRGNLPPPPSLPVGAALRVLVPAMPWPRGSFEATRKLPGGLRFERIRTRAGLSELRLEGDELAPTRALEQLAKLGYAVVGDIRRGGILVEGGLRLRPAEAAPDAVDPPGWWPGEPALLGASEPGGGQPPSFAVSKATLRALARSHPWVLRDAETDDTARYAAGALVRIGDDVLARVEDSGRVSARVWSTGERVPSVEERVVQALARRAELLRPPAGAAETNAFRLVHGEADGLPGLAIDRLGPLLRVLVTGRAAERILAPTVDALRASLGGLLGADPPIVEVLALRDRPPGRLECVRLASGRAADWGSLFEASECGTLRVSERGLHFGVDPRLSQPERPSPGFGLYLDQRENRERLARRARRGGRWLNLFAHTGAFSLALLEAGAHEVVSVDLSARVLRWLEANLALNPRLDGGRHRSLRADGRRYLAGVSGEPDFDGIVIDPPTAAAGGRGYWKLERDLPPLLAAALMRLAPGGTLFVSRNDRRRRQPASELVRLATRRAGVELRSVESAPPGPDFPRLKGFAEGDSFDAAIAQRA